MNDNTPPDRSTPAAGVVEVLGTIGPDGVVTLKRPLPRPAPPRPPLQLVED